MSLDQERHARFQAILKSAGFDCYLASSPFTMGHLTGFFEGGGERMLVIAFRPNGEPAMIVPSLSATQASHTGIRDIRTWRDGEDPAALFENLANEWSLKTAVIGVDDETPAGYLLPMQRSLPAALFKCGSKEAAGVRKQKDGGELDLMRKAAGIADRALADAIAEIEPDKTEKAIAGVLWQSMMSGGGVPTFCIVAAGAFGAEPHHDSSTSQIKRSDVVVMDWGCDVDHYLSDVTRTVCCGPASEEAKQVYRVVFQAHMAARNAIRPGVSCESIDAAAREVIEAAGYGEYFVHRTGHGIGMMGHEPPHIVAGETELLEEGQCFSVEPGIYLPGKFGVRIENIVTVTKDGHESFNEEPSAEIIEVGV